MVELVSIILLIQNAKFSSHFRSEKHFLGHVLSESFFFFFFFFGRKICVTYSATAKTVKEITKERSRGAKEFSGEFERLWITGFHTDFFAHDFRFSGGKGETFSQFEKKKFT